MPPRSIVRRRLSRHPQAADRRPHVHPAGRRGPPCTSLLAKMAARNGLPKVSMGMSADYESAVRLGATCGWEPPCSVTVAI